MIIRKSRRSLFVRSSLWLFAFFLVTATGRAQQTSTASLTGQIVDQQGGVLQDATVILLSSTGIRLQQTKTAQNGEFVFPNLTSGEYMVEAQRSGFAQAQQRVALAVGQAASHVSIQMEIAGPGQQVTVTAEVSSFKTDALATATKMNIPLNEIPQGVGVVNQALIQSQQATHFADAAENISGVNRDVLLAGDVGNAITIRGLPLGIFSNYYRDGFVFDGMVPSDMTDVDRVEILKGPASVLYGRATSSGIVNLITKEQCPPRTSSLLFRPTASARCVPLSTSPVRSEAVPNSSTVLTRSWPILLTSEIISTTAAIFLRPRLPGSPNRPPPSAFSSSIYTARRPPTMASPRLGIVLRPCPSATFTGSPGSIHTCRMNWEAWTWPTT